MDIEIARKFLLNYLPSDAQSPVNDVFNSMKESPLTILNNGLLFNHMTYFKSENKPVAIAAVNGIITGFALSHCLRFPEFSKILEEFSEAMSKSKGENVISFLEKKGK